MILYSYRNSCVYISFHVGQIVYDSSNYYLPPDIIFEKSVIKQAFDVEDLNALLPGNNWDLKDENCLHDWFENITSKLKQVRHLSCIYKIMNKKLRKFDSHRNHQRPHHHQQAHAQRIGIYSIYLMIPMMISSSQINRATMIYCQRKAPTERKDQR